MKQDVKRSQFADHKIIYIENPKDPTKKLLENEVNKSARNKTNMQESSLLSFLLHDFESNTFKEKHRLKAGITVTLVCDFKSCLLHNVKDSRIYQNYQFMFLVTQCIKM